MDEYLKKLSPSQEIELQRIRRIVHQAVPDAEEVITYGMPGFKYKKKYLIAFAAFKDHMSVFPGAGAVEAVKDRLEGHIISKGTIQFTAQSPLPEDIIKAIVLARASDISVS